MQRVAPGVRLDIRYATPNNFTHQTVYNRAACYLVPEAAERIAGAERDAEKQGFSLKLYDCYRPLSVQRKFWALVPDERYVANPATGSRHNRGAAVDLTLVDLRTGEEVPMPTGFDDFSERAHRDYAKLPQAALRNRGLLGQIMTRNGFTGLPTEWWHFDANGWERHAVLDTPFEQLP